VRAAERSHKTAIENQQDIPAVQIRELDGVPRDICQFEIGSGTVDGNL
jgi:hypothetical protein